MRDLSSTVATSSSRLRMRQKQTTADLDLSFSLNFISYKSDIYQISVNFPVPIISVACI